MDVRVARSRDVEEIVELAGGLFREDSGRRDPHADARWPARYGYDYFRDAAADTSHTLVLVAETSRIAGYLLARLRPPTSLRPSAVVVDLESMYVRPQHRSTGVGGRLVDAFRDWADEHGATVLAVSASASNDRAVDFYRRLGFAPHKIEMERRVYSADMPVHCSQE